MGWCPGTAMDPVPSGSIPDGSTPRVSDWLHVNRSSARSRESAYRHVKMRWHGSVSPSTTPGHFPRNRLSPLRDARVGQFPNTTTPLLHDSPVAKNATYQVGKPTVDRRALGYCREARYAMYTIPVSKLLGTRSSWGRNTQFARHSTRRALRSAPAPGERARSPARAYASPSTSCTGLKLRRWIGETPRRCSAAWCSGVP